MNLTTNINITEVILAILTLVLTVLTIFLSVNLISLNNSIDEKVENKVREVLYKESLESPLDVILALEYSRFLGDYNTQIWSINSLLQYFYENNNTLAFMKLKNINLGYIKKDNNEVRVNIMEYFKVKFKEKIYNNEFQGDSKAIVGSLWTLYHMRRLDVNDEYELTKYTRSLIKLPVIEKVLHTDKNLKKTLGRVF